MTENNSATVLVTDAVKGVGRDIALGLARAGWPVAVHHTRLAGEAESLVKMINSQGGRAVAVEADLTDATQVQGLSGKAAAVMGALGCLVNTAPTLDLIETFAAGLSDGLADGDVGNVINVLDRRAGQGPQYQAHTQALALSLAPKIRINTIVLDLFMRASEQIDTAHIKQWSSLSLGLKVATKEIVGAIRFVLDTSSMTGQVISLGGELYRDEAIEQI